MTQTLHVPTHDYYAMLEMSTIAVPCHVAQTHHRSKGADTQLMQDVAPDHKQG